ncbi:type II toxin-antitoxin system RelE/ParE family toxin [Pseudomonas aeruginosa]|nr:type II toxin-antitoxin system RelE/ParE family toxin [Pseudomonas aeruginosa]MCO5624701.1 type II toxin-antitoxin system RelE/ParE family toxin [Pseudomonas aeruginosa]
MQAAPAQCLRRQLFVLSEACIPSDMNQVGWKLHALKEDLAERWAIRVSGNWRLTLVITPLVVVPRGSPHRGKYRAVGRTAGA